MFLTKKHIPRRTFLRGMGVTLALPLLDSMLPAQTPSNQTAAVTPTRFLGIWNPHGWAPSYWMPHTAEEEAQNLHVSGRPTGVTGPLDKMTFVFSPARALP